jgi:hypothetical protein
MNSRVLVLILGTLLVSGLAGLALLAIQPEQLLSRLPLPQAWDAEVVGRFLAVKVLTLAILLLFHHFSLPFILDLGVDEPVFYPNRSDARRVLVARLSLSRRARVTINVHDEFNRHVATLVEERWLGAGKHFRMWDGRGRSGALLPEGSYLIEATARSRFNKATSSAWVRLDPSPHDPRHITSATLLQSWVAEEELSGRRQ